MTINRFTVITFSLILVVAFIISKDGFNFLSYSSMPAIMNMQAAKINKMVIDDGKQITELNYLDDNWFIRKNNILVKADQDRISDIVTSISKLRKDEVVASNQNNFSKFGIGDQKITVSSPDDEITVYIGNSTSLARNYVRLEDDDEIFVAGGLNNIFSPSDYRDLSPNLIPDENVINGISIHDGDTDFQIQHIDGEWTIDKEYVAKGKVSFFLNDLKTMKADDIIPTNTPLGAPSLVIDLMEKGQSQTAVFYNQGDNYYLKISGDDNIYKISSSYVDTIEKTKSDFVN